MYQRKKTYRFRSECQCDVDLFLSALRLSISRMEIEEVTLKGEDGKQFAVPDREVTIDIVGDLTLSNLRWIAAQITDCHVIAESLDTAKRYTGERDYKRVEAAEAPSVEQRERLIHGLKHGHDYLHNQLERLSNGIIAISTCSEVSPMWRPYCVAYESSENAQFTSGMTDWQRSPYTN